MNNVNNKNEEQQLSALEQLVNNLKNYTSGGIQDNKNNRNEKKLADNEIYLIDYLKKFTTLENKHMDYIKNRKIIINGDFITDEQHIVTIGKDKIRILL